MNSKKSSDEGMKVVSKKPQEEFRSKSNVSPQPIATKRTPLVKTKSMQNTEKNQIGHRKFTASILGDK